MTTQHLFFIDSKVANFETLLSGLPEGSQWYVLDQELDGIAQMQEIAAGYSNLDSIQIISHGSPATLFLGATTLSDQNISSYQVGLSAIGESLSKTGDILLYGCNVAAGDVGQKFIEQLALFTGADVAASNDLTGNLAKGGDWILEEQTGSIEATSAISIESQAAYEDTLFSYVSTANTSSWAYAVAVADNRAFTANGTDGLRIFDVSNPNNPSEVGSYNTNGPARDVAAVGNTAFLAADFGGLQIVNTSDPSNPTLVSSHALLDDDSLARVKVVGNKAYLIGLTNFELLDISDPSHPTSLGGFNYFKTTNTGSIIDVAVQGNTLISCSRSHLSDGGYQLKIFDISTPSNPILLASRDIPLSYEYGTPRDITISNNTAFVSCKGSGIVLFDITNPSNPQFLATSTVFSNSAAVVGNTVIAASGASADMIDISTKDNPTYLETVHLNSGMAEGYGEDIAVNDKYAYIADGYGGLKILEISRPPQLSISAPVATNEGDSGHTIFNFTVSRTGDTSGSSSVAFTIGKNSSGINFVSDSVSHLTGVVYFLPNEVSKTIPIKIIGDTVPEPNQTFEISLYNPTNATLGTNKATATIINDDSAVALPKLWIADWRGLEDVTGSGVNSGNNASSNHSSIRVFLSTPATSDITFTAKLQYGTAGSTDIAGLSTTGQLFTIKAGQLGADINIDVLRNYDPENPETFNVILSNVTGATVIRNSATGIIIDNDIGISDVQKTVIGVTNANYTEFLAKGDSYSGKGIPNGAVHTGIDLNEFSGTTEENNHASPVFGEVVNIAGQSNAGGGGVYIRLPNAYGRSSDVFVLYHNTIADVQKGQIVRIGDIIGDFNPTAWVPHVHLESNTIGNTSGIGNWLNPAASSLQDPRIPVAIAESNRNVSPVVVTGDTKIDAESYGLLAVGTTEFYDAIGGDDANDWYRFYVDKPSQFAARLSWNTVAGANPQPLLHFYNADGTEIDNSLLPSASAFLSDGVLTTNRFSTVLAAGEYFVRIEANGSADTTYRLRLINKVQIDGVGGGNINDVQTGLDNVDDNLIGGTGTDILYGLSGNDRLDGDADADVMYGGDGDDTYIVDNVNDTVIEIWDDVTGGIDTVETLVNYTLSDNVENLTLTGSGNYNGTGNNLYNVITGNTGNNTLNGGWGNDTLIGGAGNDIFQDDNGADTMEGDAGNDIYYVDNASDVIHETSSLSTETDIVASSISYTLGANLEGLALIGSSAINGTGNGLNNILLGNGAANVLSGGAGADAMLGGLGNDIYYVDNVGDVVTESSTLSTEIDTVYASVSHALSANVENLTLTGTSAINGTGNDLANTLIGNSGNNALIGGGGNDVLNGFTGADTMEGDIGNDIYFVDNAGDVVRETSSLSTETDIVGSSISYTLGANLERLVLIGGSAINGTGNGLNNILLGNGAANVLSGGAGADTMQGGLGNDIYYVDNVGDVVMESSTLSTEIDTVYATVSHALSANVENLTLTGASAINGTGNGLANTLIGNSGNNVLIGGGGNDVLNGFTGADTMEGGIGNDIYFVDNAGDVVHETSSLSTETDIVGSSISYTLGANLERLVLIGGSAINGIGNNLDNTIIGNNSNNILQGGLGNDILVGSGGQDSFVLNDLSRDTITDFSVIDDQIQLENSVFTRLTTTGILSASNFHIGTSAADADDYVIYDNSNGALLYDNDGSGATAAIQIAQLGTSLAMTNADFLVI